MNSSYWDLILLCVYAAIVRFVKLPCQYFTLLKSTLQVAQQVFRRYETYSVAFHSALLIGPPAIIGAVLWALSCLPKMPALGVILLLYGTYLGALAASVVAYRLGPWHPLAGFPGPVVFRTSKLWMAGCAAAGRECFVVKALHEQYGDVVRTGECCAGGLGLGTSLTAPMCMHMQCACTQVRTSYRYGIRRSSVASWGLRACRRVRVRAAR